MSNPSNLALQSKRLAAQLATGVLCAIMLALALWPGYSQTTSVKTVHMGKAPVGHKNVFCVQLDQQQLNFLIKLDINDRFQLSYSSQSRAQAI